jgi:hypothetical protein
LIDYFAIGLTHALLALAAWRLLLRDDLDGEDAGQAKRPRKPWLKPSPAQAEEAGDDA